METSAPTPLAVSVVKQLAQQKASELGFGSFGSGTWVNPHLSNARLPKSLETRNEYMHL